MRVTLECTCTSLAHHTSTRRPPRLLFWSAPSSSTCSNGRSRVWPRATAAWSCSRPPPASARPRCSSTPRRSPPTPAASCAAPRRARSSATSRSASCARCSRRRCATRRSDERAQLLDGAAAPAGELLLDGTAPGGDATMLVAHSVLWLCSALAERRPLVLVVDDAQWADRSSLEVLAYLARRIDDLPLLIARRRPRRRPRRGVRPAEPARRRALGDRAAPAAADAVAARRS